MDSVTRVAMAFHAFNIDAERSSGIALIITERQNILSHHAAAAEHRSAANAHELMNTRLAAYDGIVTYHYVAG